MPTPIIANTIDKTSLERPSTTTQTSNRVSLKGSASLILLQRDLAFCLKH